jgi:hypothetical protein
MTPMRFGRTLGDERAEAYPRCICTGLKYLLALQCTDRGTTRERRGFGLSLSQRAQRIDITGHAASAFMRTVDSAIRMPPAGVTRACRYRQTRLMLSSSFSLVCVWNGVPSLLSRSQSNFESAADGCHGLSEEFMAGVCKRWHVTNVVRSSSDASPILERTALRERVRRPHRLPFQSRARSGFPDSVA